MVQQVENKYQPVIITDIRQEVPGVKTFILEPALSYKAGQFLTFAIQHHHREERRSFSISSSPVLNEPLSITVKRVDNGVYSRLLIDRAKPGDLLYTTGAAGLFTLPGDIAAYKQLFFFAAGIGITPIYSIIKTVLFTQPGLTVVLVYSNSTIADTVFYNELNELADQFFERFRIVFLFSNSFQLARARLNKELLPTLLAELSTAPKENTLYYTCGPFSYMRMVLYALEEQGIPADNVKKENFNTERKPIIRHQPPDKNAHNTIIKIAGKEYSFTAQYPETILQAAKKNGVVLPYSCEIGRCGSCAAICTKGKVWMSNNEVLTNSDLEKGMILTCVGYPVDGNIYLEIS